MQEVTAEMEAAAVGWAKQGLLEVRGAGWGERAELAVTLAVQTAAVKETVERRVGEMAEGEVVAAGKEEVVRATEAQAVRAVAVEGAQGKRQVCVAA